MGKNRDLIQILILVIIGMLIPFLGSLVIIFGLEITNISDLSKIVKAFGYFLLIFGIELFIIFLYYHVKNKIASKKLKKVK